jgi:hypothetical protein
MARSCARAASGQPAAPPSPAMNSRLRRLICSSLCEGRIARRSLPVPGAGACPGPCRAGRGPRAATVPRRSLARRRSARRSGPQPFDPAHHRGQHGGRRVRPEGGPAEWARTRDPKGVLARIQPPANESTNGATSPRGFLSFQALAGRCQIVAKNPVSRRKPLILLDVPCRKWAYKPMRRE